jgi:potassium voltage-gated channel Eag-related subfamily H protein 8
MEVLQNDMVVAILGKGDLVGCDIPFSLIPEALIKSSSDVKALTYCDLKSIHVPGLLDVLKMYPEFAETFCTEIIHDLTFNLREGSQVENEGMLHGAHSLTLPSISEEDDEEDDEDADDDDHEDSGSGSPPSSPSMGTAVQRNRVNADWNRRNIINASTEGMPLIQPTANRRPALRFQQNKQHSSTSKGSSAPEKLDLKEEIELTRCSVDRLDSQMLSIKQDMSKLSDDLKTAMALLQQLCSTSGASSASTTSSRLPQDKTVSCQDITNCTAGDLTAIRVLDDKCSSPSLTNSSSCSQIKLPQLPSNVKPVGITGEVPSRVWSQTRGSQTDRSLLEDFLKMTDSGSPPPNSGYSSSSSNEDRVRLLIGMHCQRNTEDSESASDDSVLRASNSLTIQSTSSRDVSPFKGSRNSWSTSFGEPCHSPLSSPRPMNAVHHAPPTKSTSTSTQENKASASQTLAQCAIDIEGQSSQRSEETKTSISGRRKIF